MTSHYLGEHLLNVIDPLDEKMTNRYLGNNLLDEIDAVPFNDSKNIENLIIPQKPNSEEKKSIESNTSHKVKNIKEEKAETFSKTNSPNGEDINNMSNSIEPNSGKEHKILSNKRLKSKRYRKMRDKIRKNNNKKNKANPNMAKKKNKGPKSKAIIILFGNGAIHGC